jgi:phage terminase large subunit
MKWAMKRLGVEAHFHTTENPLEITYRPTGQKIYFRGLDDPLKITSITVEVGVLCWLYVEEAYEIDEDSFDTLVESIQGGLPEGLFRQTVLLLNPWHERCWIKARFFDISDEEAEAEGVFRQTTTYECNEFLDSASRAFFERLKVRNPRRARVVCFGDWGVTDGLVYENHREWEFTLDDIRKPDPAGVPTVHLETVCGLDFGYTNNPSAFVIGFLDKTDPEAIKFYVWDEFYLPGLSNLKITQKIQVMGYGKEQITADSAEPKSVDDLKDFGLRAKGAVKGPDSKRNGIQWIQDIEIIVHSRCENFLKEIGGYTWKKDKFGKNINEPVDRDDHLMDAMRYGLERFMKKKKWRY